MKKFYIGENKYLEQKVLAFYNCDYVGYQKQGNPDFINHLKNMTNQYNELDLVEDFVKVSEGFVKDMKRLFDKGEGDSGSRHAFEKAIKYGKKGLSCIEK